VKMVTMATHNRKNEEHEFKEWEFYQNVINWNGKRSGKKCLWKGSNSYKWTNYNLKMYQLTHGIGVFIGRIA
jgi:hypothetical protein